MKHLAVLVTFLTALLLAPPAHADHAWGGKHWSTPTTPTSPTSTSEVTVYVQDRTRGRFPVQHAAALWSASPHINLVVTPRQSHLRHRAHAYCPPRRCIDVRVDRSLNWAGVASVRWEGDHYTHAWVRLQNPDATYEARLVVTCHEIGHALGLAHRAEDGNTSCMRARTYGGGRPDAHDLEMLASLYSHSG